MSDFTPGPWKYVVGNFNVIAPNESNSGKDYYHVANTEGHDYVRRVANARLIAAAPDLLEAAWHALLALRANPESPMTASECLLSLAIAKATGDVS